MKKINLLLIIAIFLVSCGSVKEAGQVLRNEKKNTTDEFLVKKRSPLVLPPDFDVIPEPGSISKNKNSEEDTIKKILNAPNEEGINSNKSSSVEESILNRIRK
jgi:hypothetical protein